MSADAVARATCYEEVAANLVAQRFGIRRALFSAAWHFPQNKKKKAARVKAAPAEPDDEPVGVISPERARLVEERYARVQAALARATSFQEAIANLEAEGYSPQESWVMASSRFPEP